MKLAYDGGQVQVRLEKTIFGSEYFCVKQIILIKHLLRIQNKSCVPFPTKSRTPKDHKSKESVMPVKTSEGEKFS